MATAAKPGQEGADTVGSQGAPKIPDMPGTPGMPNFPPGGKMPELVTIDGWTFAKGIQPMEPADHVAALRNMEVQPDDVFVCAFPKAGTHWTWEMVSMLKKGKAEYEPRSKIAMMMELLPIEDIVNTPSPRIFNTHFLFRFLPYQIREKGARIVYVSRNPKDVAVSFYHHMQGVREPLKFKGSFDEFLPARFFQSMIHTDWFTYEQDWEKVFQVLPDLKVIHMVYEDMKEDPVGNVERLAEFLGTGASKELCQQIAEACRFDRHKAADKNKARPPRVEALMDTRFLEDSRLYRKGEVGDWKNWFTVALDETFDKVFAERMKYSKLTYRYTYTL